MNGIKTTERFELGNYVVDGVQSQTSTDGWLIWVSTVVPGKRKISRSPGDNVESERTEKQTAKNLDCESPDFNAQRWKLVDGVPPQKRFVRFYLSTIKRSLISLCR